MQQVSSPARSGTPSNPKPAQTSEFPPKKKITYEWSRPGDNVPLPLTSGDYKTTHTKVYPNSSIIIPAETSGAVPTNSSPTPNLLNYIPNSGVYSVVLTDSHPSMTTATVLHFTQVGQREDIWAVARRLQADPQFAGAFSGKSEGHIVALLKAYNAEIAHAGNEILPKDLELVVMPNGDTVDKRLELAIRGMATGLGEEAYEQIKSGLMIIVGALLATIAAGAAFGPAAKVLLGEILAALGLSVSAAQTGYLLAFLADACFFSNFEDVEWKGEGAKPVLASLLITLGTLGVGRVASGVRAANALKAEAALGQAHSVPTGEVANLVTSLKGAKIAGTVRDRGLVLSMNPLPLGGAPRYILVGMVSQSGKPTWVKVEFQSGTELMEMLASPGNFFPEGLSLPKVSGKTRYIFANDPNAQFSDVRHLTQMDEVVAKGLYNQASQTNILPLLQEEAAPPKKAPRYSLGSSPAERVTAMDIPLNKNSLNGVNPINWDISIKLRDVLVKLFNQLKTANGGADPTFRQLLTVTDEQFLAVRDSKKTVLLEFKELLDDYGLRVGMSEGELQTFIQTGQ